MFSNVVLSFLLSAALVVRVFAQQCGVQHAADPLQLQSSTPLGPYGQLVGGLTPVTDTYGGQLCWQATVFDVDGLYCGATIIGPRTILTSAFCTVRSTSPLEFHTADHLYVGVGVQNQGYNDTVFAPDSFYNGCGGNYSVQSVVRHPSYDGTPGKGDLAVITLTESLDLTKACLCSLCVVAKEPAVGETCAIAASGYDPLVRTLLNYAKVAIKSNTPASCYIQNTTNTADALCAVLPASQDACVENLGGPLMCWDSQQKNYYVAGVYVYKPESCVSGIGGQHVKVNSYADWILAAVVS